MIYSIILLLLSGIFILTAAASIRVRGRTDLLPKLIRIPRDKTTGMILTAAVLIWCIPHAKVVLPVNAGGFFGLIVGTALVFVLLCAYLDYLPARAFAVICILGSYTMLNLTFARAVPCSIFLVTACYLTGIFGIVLSARPHWMRLILQNIVLKKAYRTAVCLFCLYTGAACAFTSIVYLFAMHSAK